MILLLMAYHRTIYTLGFMGWFDTFKNTKINYYCIALGLAMGPLIYLYIRTTLVAPFRLKNSDALHFMPVLCYVVYRLVILAHDSQQPDWDVGYDGVWHREFHMVYVSPILEGFKIVWDTLYLAFSIQLVSRYSAKIKMYFSNTYQVELNWLYIFLAVYVFLFGLSTLIMVLDSFIVDLDYKQIWWIHLFSSIAIVFLGIKAYFTDLSSLHDLTQDLLDSNVPSRSEEQGAYKSRVDRITNSLEDSQAFLNPELNLADLAEMVDLSKHETSDAVNNGFKMNFNELINSYRVKEVKKRILDPDYNHLSLVAIALDCGFNSKATFNRVFKLQTGQSPTQFKQSQGI